MRLLLIRHGDAGDYREWARSGRPDDERPLTDEGRDEMLAVARGLNVIEPEVDVIATSPLVRAVQTADAVASVYPNAQRETIDALHPDASFQDFVDWLRAHRRHALVMAVGHNPHLSDLASWLAAHADAVDMKKGSAVLLEFDDDIGEATADLLWYMKPKELIELAR